LRPAEPPGARRLFFALLPLEAERSALAEAVEPAVRSVEGRAVPPGNYHVTLAFLGSVDAGRLTQLELLCSTVAASCAAPPPLAFTALAHWERSEILAAVCTDESPVLLELTRALRCALVAAGFSPDLKPFRAHVTVARKVRGAQPRALAAGVRWSCAALALMESRSGGRGSVYSVVESQLLVKAENLRG